MEGSSNAENYYDILNVRTDCSDKDIKTAYVELSKKFHPDVKGVKQTDQQQTARFLKISEAYQTLSKPKLRTEYDQNLQAAHSMRIYETGKSMRSEVHRPWEIKPDYDTNPGPYYGIKGLNKTTNTRVAIALIVLGIFGGVFGFASVSQSFSLNRQRLDDVSARASEHHQKIRSDAEKYTKDEQLRRVIDRIAAKADT